MNDELVTATNDMAWAILTAHVLVAFVQGDLAGVALFVTGVPEIALLTGAMMALAFIIWELTSVAVTDDYLRAMVIDRGSDLHSAVIFVGILGGSSLLGPIGLSVGPLLIGFALTAIEVLGDQYGVIKRPAT
ncbi:AI-2E family transporter [Natrinema marinum]|uniref:AI-2E family transporter n=1 Tax=Natrinema marinum TaxID=2961598 RepID=UPI0020C84557|nr:AI-2E family transporter [Natrinema marinum]